MINYNGKIVAGTDIAIEENRAFLYGDSVFETFKVLDGKILFAEDHYFRLMASMRIVRMEIPMFFTMEYMEEQVVSLTDAIGDSSVFRARLSMFRLPGGYYLPQNNDTGFIITAQPVSDALYTFSNSPYEIDLFRDYYVSKQLLSTIKSANKMVQITGSIYANENGLQNCLLLNDDKNVAEALQGNIFMLTGNRLVTPPLSDGCLNGIMRKQVLALAVKIEGLEVAEATISPFDLQKADELFITNVITGLQPVTKYRKKEYGTTLAAEIIKRLNAKVRLS